MEEDTYLLALQYLGCSLTLYQYLIKIAAEKKLTRGMNSTANLPIRAGTKKKSIEIVEKKGLTCTIEESICFRCAEQVCVLL
jgi:hypothetical protein